MGVRWKHHNNSLVSCSWAHSQDDLARKHKMFWEEDSLLTIYRLKHSCCLKKREIQGNDGVTVKPRFDSQKLLDWALPEILEKNLSVYRSLFNTLDCCSDDFFVKCVHCIARKFQRYKRGLFKTQHKFTLKILVVIHKNPKRLLSFHSDCQFCD